MDGEIQDFHAYTRKQLVQNCLTGCCNQDRQPCGIQETQILHEILSFLLSIRLSNIYLLALPYLGLN